MLKYLELSKSMKGKFVFLIDETTFFLESDCSIPFFKEKRQGPTKKYQHFLDAWHEQNIYSDVFDCNDSSSGKIS